MCTMHAITRHGYTEEVALPKIEATQCETNDMDLRGRPHSNSSDEIDLSLADRGHLSFGGGIHRCLGSHLARRELRIVVEEMLRMIPDFEISGSYEPRVHWPSGTLHLTSLPITFPKGGTA